MLVSIQVLPPGALFKPAQLAGRARARAPRSKEGAVSCVRIGPTPPCRAAAAERELGGRRRARVGFMERS
jgi:hypothetical protein